MHDVEVVCVARTMMWKGVCRCIRVKKRVLVARRREGVMRAGRRKPRLIYAVE